MAEATIDDITEHEKRKLEEKKNVSIQRVANREEDFPMRPSPSQVCRQSAKGPTGPATSTGNVYARH